MHSVVATVPEVAASESGTLRTTEATRRALTYAWRMCPLEARELGTRLYRYPSSPAAPRFLARFSSLSGVRSQLDICGVDVTAAHNGWRSQDEAIESGWLFWSRLTDATEHGSTRPTYKLFVTPKLEQLRAVLHTVAAMAVRTDAMAFKVGAHAYNLLRPDRLIVYFRAPASLETFAAQLSPSLRGLTGCALPFAGNLDEHGLLSWGVDLPMSRAHNGAPESWRMRVTQHAAAALCAAHETAAAAFDAEEAIRFVLQRLALEGIDVTSMTPALSTRAVSGEAQ